MNENMAKKEVVALEKNSGCSGCLKTGLIVLVVAVITCVATIFVMNRVIFPKRLKPVELSEKEEKVLESKIDKIGFHSEADAEENRGSDGEFKPEAYVDNDDNRTIEFTQRELNGLLNRNSEMGERLAIHLKKDLASAKIIIPIDEDFPFMGGKTMKASAGLNLKFADGRPVIIIKGISLWGVPLPNAWLGGIKNIDLVQEFGDAGGFWDSLAEGIDYLSIDDGRLTIRLKE